MTNSIYVALSRQVAQFRDLEETSGNLANANTNGYQSRKVLFTDYLTEDGNHHKVAYAHDVGNYRDTRNGSMKVTEGALDVAIQGPGYFAVQTPEGTRYTRNGAFTLDGQGELVTASGLPVLDGGGQPIFFQAEDKDISIKQNGAIVVDGEERSTLGVSEFDNDQALVAEGDSLLNPGKAQARPAEESTVKHGVLEASNVEPVVEMAHLVELQRSVNDTSKLIETMYDLVRKSGRTWLSSSNA